MTSPKAYVAWDAGSQVIGCPHTPTCLGLAEDCIGRPERATSDASTCEDCKTMYGGCFVHHPRDPRVTRTLDPTREHGQRLIPGDAQPPDFADTLAEIASLTDRERRDRDGWRETLQAAWKGGFNVGRRSEAARPEHDPSKTSGAAEREAIKTWLRSSAAALVIANTGPWPNAHRCGDALADALQAHDDEAAPRSAEARPAVLLNWFCDWLNTHHREIGVKAWGEAHVMLAELRRERGQSGEKEAATDGVQVVRADGHGREDDRPAVPGASGLEGVPSGAGEGGRAAVVGRSALAADRRGRVSPNASLALAACIAAMKKSVDVGCTDHLDADDDGGAWWYGAIEAGEAALRASPSSCKARGPITHKLKTHTPYFEAIVDGRKTFEVRKNDRDFRVGDVLRLEEWNPGCGYSDAYTTWKVVYLAQGVFGLPADICVMGIVPAFSPDIEAAGQFTRVVPGDAPKGGT